MTKMQIAEEMYLDGLAILGEECMDELENLHIPVCRNVRWKINTRSKNNWGMCSILHYDMYFDFQIEIAVHLLENPDAFDSLKNTVIHELLHTCPDCFCHTGLWKKYAEKVNRAYGYNIQRCVTKEEVKQFKRTSLCEYRQEETVKYRVQCVECGEHWDYRRAGKIVKIYKRCTCGRCGGSLKLITF